MSNKDYNTNVQPLLVPYNHVNDIKNNIDSLIPVNQLEKIRGSGMYNPAPLYPQTSDNGNAFSNINTYKSLLNTYTFNVPNIENTYVNPSGSVDIKDTWEKNINYNIKPSSGDNYQYYDEYQRWALNTTRKTDPYILPFLFSKINIKFIQESVVNYVKKARNINIQTKQDTDNLLNLILSSYNKYIESPGIYGTNDYAINATDEPNCNFSNILGNLNKEIIEKYVQNVLSGLNITEYYIKDISTLPMPFTRPVDTSIKGSNNLGFVGFFEDNHEFTKNISSYNIRNSMPNNVPGPFGN